MLCPALYLNNVMIIAPRIRAVFGGPLSRKTEVTFTPEMLEKVGACLVEALSNESKKYFAKRGWVGHDPMGGPPIWESFSYRIRGKSTLELTSTFYGMKELAAGGIPERKMTWLTQEAKDRNPSEYPLTKQEQKLGMKRTGRVSQGDRMPLIVPMKGTGGIVVFRQAPLTTGSAWVHPGIAKFTFFETALRKWRGVCAELIVQEMFAQLSSGK